MKEITLEVLCAHLPHKTQIYNSEFNSYGFLKTGLVRKFETHGEFPKELKLLLRPLSTLDQPLKELDGKSAMEVICDKLNEAKFGWPEVYIEDDMSLDAAIFLVANGSGVSIRCVPDYYMVPMEAFEIIRSFLLSLHYDLFGLLEAGLALPLETK